MRDMSEESWRSHEQAQLLADILDVVEEIDPMLRYSLISVPHGCSSVRIAMRANLRRMIPQATSTVTNQASN